MPWSEPSLEQVAPPGDVLVDVDGTQRWWVKAIIAALAGLLFSLVLSACLSLGSAFRVAPLVAVEQAGIDFGMRAYTAFTGSPRTAKAIPHYVFVDVDRPACDAFSTASQPCGTGRSVPPDLIIAFAEAARRSGAVVVLIDVKVPEDVEERTRLARGLAADDGPWVIASLGVRPRVSSEQLELTAEGESLLGPVEGGRLRSGKLLLAPFVTATDAFAADGVIRHYPLLARIKGVDTGPEARWLPSAPFLASGLADPSTANAILCRYYPVAGDPCAAAGSAPSSPVIRFGEQAQLRNRVFFSLPALAAVGEDQQVVYRDRYLGFYDRVPASALLQGTEFSWPPDLMQGAVVILGTSAPEGHDWHVTPLGPMTGPEIVLNAIRAFSEFSPLSEPSASAGASDKLAAAWRGFSVKVGAVVTGTLIMLVGWLAIFWIGDHWTVAPRWVRRVACVLVFFGVLTLTALIELFSGISSLQRNAEVAEATDLLTPLLALGLEGFAEAARTFAHVAEALVAWGLMRSVSLIKKLRERRPNEDV